MYKKLYRSRTDSLLGGVCGGLGAYLGINSTWIRLFFILLTLGSGFGLLMYLVMWLMIPAAEAGTEAAEAGKPNPQANVIVGAALLGMGLLFLFKNFHLAWVGAFHLGMFWPLLLIAIGGVAVWRIVHEA